MRKSGASLLTLKVSRAGCLCLHDLQLVNLCKELCVVLSFLTALYLAVGFESGTVHLVNPQTLQSCPEDSFHYSKVRIHLLAFSLDSNYFATAVRKLFLTVLLK